MPRRSLICWLRREGLAALLQPWFRSVGKADDMRLCCPKISGLVREAQRGGVFDV